ncbi:hypothetical protein O6H91_16G029400 [Diphasiastrum complanatum]|uniref:Uncharacterized protein n=1 Tax=Diphasiastrum complanatum TaxID=34168 RepID=A0ACC2BB78_DIPCM|nr:hypothetical protein O6H91_16G029400 [Diphasiastrum complanatum]
MDETVQKPMKSAGSCLELNFPLWYSRNSSLRDSTVFEEKELVMDEDSISFERLTAIEHPRPFSSFGSFQQKHGSIQDTNSRFAKGKLPGTSLEAPAKLGKFPNISSNAPSQRTDATVECARNPALIQASTTPIDIVSKNCQNGEEGSRLQKSLSKTKSRLKKVDLEEAWERRRILHFSKEMSLILDDQKERAVGRSVSDCGDRRSSLQSRSSAAPLPRTKSLTDDDLDELRGCIDLGFAFRNNEADRELWSTLPALELCYAISQQLKGVESTLTPSPLSPSEPSPISPLEGDLLDVSTNEGSTSSSPNPSWRISSPGDHPQQVKTRLKHWAQAVAFTVRQNL